LLREASIGRPEKRCAVRPRCRSRGGQGLSRHPRPEER